MLSNTDAITSVTGKVNRLNKQRERSLFAPDSTVMSLLTIMLWLIYYQRISHVSF